MTIRDRETAAPARPPLATALDVYGRVMSGVLMFLGLRHWAVIMGVIAGGGGAFETMPTAWQIATMHLAVVDLVAAVGLWQRVAWGNVLWIYAALAEIAMHTLFTATFGTDYLIIAFHVATVGGFVLLTVAARRLSRP